MHDLSDVGTQLISQRVSKGFDVETAACMADLGAEKLAAAEAGEVALSEDELERLAEAYGIGLSAFFGGHTTPISYLFGA